MKILFVISTPIEYSSSANMRNVALINGLIQNGHQVDLVSDGYDTSSKYVDKSICKINFSKRYYLRKISTTNKSNVSSNNSIKEKIFKLISKLSIYDNRKVLIRKAKKIKLTCDYDIMISSSDPKSSHLLAKVIKKYNNNLIDRWFQYWGDPFAEDINKSTIIPMKYIKKAEKKILSLADKIIYVSPFTLSNQKSVYPMLSSRMYFLPVPYLKKIIYKENKQNEVILGYFGDYLSKDRNIIPLYKSMEKLTNLQLIIYGNSDVNIKETNNVIIKKRQSSEIIKMVQEKCSILICICNKKGTQIPGKIYHYAATNKPILIILDGENSKEIENYLKKFNRYEFCLNNEKSIILAIKKLMKKGYNNYCPSDDLGCDKIAASFIDEMK